MHKLFIALWSVALSFIFLSLIGTTPLLSNLVGRAHIPLIIELGFFMLSGLFAIILWRLMPMPRHKLIQILMLLAPIVIFLIFLV